MCRFQKCLYLIRRMLPRRVTGFTEKSSSPLSCLFEENLLFLCKCFLVLFSKTFFNKFNVFLFQDLCQHLLITNLFFIKFSLIYFYLDLKHVSQFSRRLLLWFWFNLTVHLYLFSLAFSIFSLSSLLSIETVPCLIWKTLSRWLP